MPSHLPSRTRHMLSAGLLALVCPVAADAAQAYVSTEGGGIAVIDLDRLELMPSLPAGGKGPRGLAVTTDGKYLLAANKGTGDLSVIDLATGQLVRRVPIGQNPEFVRVAGNQAFVTYEPGERSGPPGAAPPPSAKGKSDDDKPLPAEIAVIDLKDWRVNRTIRSGLETEGIEFSRDGKLMLVTNEGDDTVTVYENDSGRQVKLLPMPAGSRPRGIKASPDGNRYVVTLESANAFVVLDATNFRVLRTVPTRTGPYGVAFDRAGERLFVAASRADTLQVFDAQTFASLADIAIGKRCWHFSFTPDDARLLVACGRSNAVYVIDARTYKPVRQFDGLPLSWGIVTYPKSVGSIDSP
ncbi:PQQ-dependent catabolism-associated beta-propeller protein [compost metagenome]